MPYLNKYPRTNKESVIYSDDIKIHTKGIGLQKFLSTINGYENKNQHNLRVKHAISNKPFTAKLLRPVANIWRAKGVNVDVSIGAKDINVFAELIKPVYEFVKYTWFDAFVSDPNTIIKVDGVNLSLIDSKRIYHIEIRNKKIIQVIYLHEIIENQEGEEIKIYKHYQENKIVTISVNGDTETTKEEENKLELMPFVLSSIITDIDKNIFLTPIDNELDLLGSFVRKNSVKEIFEFLHGYPKFWQYVEPCDICNGSKKIEFMNESTNETSFISCPKCNGVGHFGKTDVSDSMNITLPSDEQTVINQPMGFEIPPTDTWEEMRTELNWFWNIIFESQWGTTIEKGENETATGRFIDIQPVVNRLNEYTDEAERVTNEIIKIIGAINIPNSFKYYIVNFGRRFIIESAELSLERYEKAKTQKLTTTILDFLLKQYFTAEYQNNELMYQRSTKLTLVEPYVHNSIEEVLAMDVSEDLKLKKKYFSEWSKTIETKVIIDKQIINLQAELLKFAKTF